jgi:phage-related protein
MFKFEVRFLEPAKVFLEDLDEKTRGKVLFNIWKAREINDSELFKKLSDEIWEFRTHFKSNQIRFLAFWDKTGRNQILVITTHGFIKKTQKTPKREIERAVQLRREYLENK